MQNVLRLIPNALTLGNLFFGFLALVYLAREQAVLAIYCVVVSLILDFFDGFAARLLKVDSKMGVQLDSLADAQTFGVVPGFILFNMITISQGFYFVEITEWPLSVILNSAVAGAIPIAAAYRLGKFNLVEGHADHFEGLPTPAMSLFVFGIPLVLETHYHLNFYHPLSSEFIQVMADVRRWDPEDVMILNLMYNPLYYQVVSVVLALLMVSNVPMLSLKFKGIGWAKNKWRYGILIWLAVCYVIFLLPYLSLPFRIPLIDYLIVPIFMIGYFILSFIYATFGVSKIKQRTDEV